MTFVQFVHGTEGLLIENPVFWGRFGLENTISSNEKNGVKKRKIVLTNRKNSARIRKRSSGRRIITKQKEKCKNLKKVLDKCFVLCYYV